jgi:hypothetical protein
MYRVKVGLPTPAVQLYAGCSSAVHVRGSENTAGLQTGDSTATTEPDIFSVDNPAVATVAEPADGTQLCSVKLRAAQERQLGSRNALLW